MTQTPIEVQLSYVSAYTVYLFLPADGLYFNNVKGFYS